MDRLKAWLAARSPPWLKRIGAWLEARAVRIPWHPWVTLPTAGALAVFVLGTSSYCDPRGADTPGLDPTPKLAMIPLPALQRIVESMADTQIGLWRGLKGWEERGPERIIVTDTVPEPYPVTNVVSVIRDGRLATVVQERTATGWTQRIEKGRNVEGCDELRIVGGEVICDTPVLGKFYGVVGSGALTPFSALNSSFVPTWDAWAGVEWKRHRDSSWAVRLLAGIDQSARLGVEWRPEIW